MTINFNTEPYYDDFDENQRFYRILYRPAYAVQARELTQMQSILQDQIKNLGNHIFKEGSMVIPGQISVDTNIAYIKLESSYNSVLADELLASYVGKIVKNTNGLKAQVIYYSKSSGVEKSTLFVKYLNSDPTTNTTAVFSAGDILTDTAIVGTLSQIQVFATTPTGLGSIAQIQQGVYYIKNHFVLVEPQTIVLDKYSNTPTYRVGLLAVESITTPEDDATLLDNAQGSFNYAAPGAHRYHIELTLSKLSTSSTSDSDFVELVRVNSGQTESIVEKPNYNEIEKTLARRTFDESGNYTVRPFNYDVREHRNNNRGAWVTSRAYLVGDVVTNGGNIYTAKNSATSGSIAPTFTSLTALTGYDGASSSGVNWEYSTSPYYNRGAFTPEQGGDEAKLAIALEPGKAYVRGYEIEKISTTFLPVKKCRDSTHQVSVDNAVVSATMGNYCVVTNVNGAPPIDTFGTVNLYNVMTPAVGTLPTPVSLSSLVIGNATGGFTFTTVSPSSLYAGQLITISGIWGAGAVATVGTITGYTLTVANAASVTATTSTNVISGLITTSLAVGMPIQFSATLNNIIASTTYYVASIPTSGSITLSATPGGSVVTISSTTSVTLTAIATINPNGITYRVSTTGLSSTGFTLVQNDSAGTALVTSTGTPTGVTASVSSGLIGTARVRGMEWHSGTVGAQTAQYKLSLFDVKLNTGFSFQRDVKSVFFNIGSNVKTNFSADINPLYTRIGGNATASSSATITGVQSSFLTDLKVGDYIYLNATYPKIRIGSIPSNYQLILDSAVTVSGVTIDRISTDIIEPANQPLIFPLPNFAIKSVSDITYTVIQKFTGTAGSDGTPSAGSCTLSIPTGSTATFASTANTANYTVIYTDTSLGGVIVSPTSISGATTTSLSIVLPSATYASKTFTVFAAINKSSSSVGSQRTKTLKTASTEGTKVALSTQAAAIATDITLGQADGVRLVSVKMKNGTFPTINLPSLPVTVTTSTNVVTVNSTAGFVPGMPIVFGTTIGSVIAGTIYYIFSVDSGTTLKLTSTIGGSVFSIAATTTVSSTVSVTTTIAWAASTVVSVGTQITSGGNLYVVTVAGTTGSSAPSHTSGTATNGTATLSYLGANTYNIDITDRYDFDNGQRATHYDLCKISLKSSYPPPSAPIEVDFQYYTTSPGDFFTVTSYGVDNYKTIPYFNRQPLRDYVDFRPRIDTNGTTFSSQPFLMPKRGEDVTCDFTYYLGRKTKIAIDTAGNFFNTDGAPSLYPQEPPDPELGMVLYNLTLEPYTFTTTSTSATVNKIDNKRYTMRDIGKLEQRIDNLEYYTSLSLLESDTQSMKITDSTGLDRYKNGFIVDNFTGHNVADPGSPDYVCSIDMENAELRPFYTMNNVNLLEKATSDGIDLWTASTSVKLYSQIYYGSNLYTVSVAGVTGSSAPNHTTSLPIANGTAYLTYAGSYTTSAGTRAASNYKLYGDVITLPVVSNPVLVQQPYASRLENINPFAVFTFIGDVTINPASDDWFETDRRPDIVVDVMGNFNTVKTLAEKAGVLGTVWNAWQTQWSGRPISQGVQRFEADRRWGDGGAYLDQMFGLGPYAPGWAHRVVTSEIVATQVGQSRTGVKTSVVSKIDRQLVADRILSSAAIPYIRSRNVLIQVKKLKPSTRFYPFFDGIDITSYCTPATKLIYIQPSGWTGSFNTTSNVGGNSTETARLINGDSQVCLNKGDVIVGQTSGATAVVVGTEFNYDTSVSALNVVNISGTFQLNETITGSISGATAKVNVLPTIATLGSNIITNSAGDINLIFNIPNTEAVRFRTGSREFKLVDVSSSTGAFTSRGRATYRAEGILETKQATVNAVRNGLIVEEQVTDNQVIIETTNRVVSDTGWYDPLAQTFLVQCPGGAFLSSIDIFLASRDSNIPITLELREVVNGYPGKRVLPFSRVTLTPSQVNISTNTVLVDGVSWPSYDTATNFAFQSPVYVEDNQEYCVVLASDSNNYRAWISQLGDIIPNSNRTISEQPYNGVLFKSQNASTWTADQSQDLKFTIYRCEFNTTVVGSVTFENDKLQSEALDTDPFEFRAGSTSVRVWHRDHAIPVASNGAAASYVTISNVTGTLNGVPASELNGDKLVSNIDIDSYTITVTTTPTSSGYAGGTGIKATKNVQFDACQPSVQFQSFPETNVDFVLSTRTGQSVDPVAGTYQNPYQVADSNLPVVVNDTNYFTAPRMVANAKNEAVLLSNNKSLSFTAKLSSTNSALSPIIDTDRTSFIAISNKINYATEAATNVSGLDDHIIISSSINLNSQLLVGFSTTGIYTSDTATKLLFLSLTIGKYLTIAGSGGSGNNGTFLITAIATDGSSVTLRNTFIAVLPGTALTITQRELFVDEIAPQDSTAYSSYVTKKINLVNPSKFVKIQFATNLPKEAAIEVYYKTNKVGSTAVFDTVTYTLVSPDATIVNNDNITNKFVDVSYSLSDLPSFDAVLVKIVMKSTNSSAIPRIKDLRIIACA